MPYDPLCMPLNGMATLTLSSPEAEAKKENTFCDSICKEHRRCWAEATSEKEEGCLSRSPL
jgi:hypothetical protein